MILISMPVVETVPLPFILRSRQIQFQSASSRKACAAGPAHITPPHCDCQSPDPANRKTQRGLLLLMVLDSAHFPLRRLLGVSSAEPRRQCGARFGFDCTGSSWGRRGGGRKKSCAASFLDKERRSLLRVRHRELFH